MLFTGVSEHTLDAKFRLAVPAKYRNQWSVERDGQAWFSLPWPTGHLKLYTEAGFTTLAKAGIQTLTPDADAADLELALYSLAERLEMDAQGRLVIPKKHLEMAKLAGSVAVVGARNHLQVHDLKTWTAGENNRFQSLPFLAERVNAKPQHPGVLRPD